MSIAYHPAARKTKKIRTVSAITLPTVRKRTDFSAATLIFPPFKLPV